MCIWKQIKMFRIIFLSLILVSLSGCGFLSIFSKDVPDPQITIHPELPRPVQSQQVDWIIIEQDDGVYVGTSYQQFLNHLESEEDKLRYIRQINKSICYYRQDLEEEFCQQSKDKEE